MSEKINLRIGLLSLFILAAAATRLLPHPPNFTPVGALGLFGAAYFSRKYLAFLAPLIAMWVSDLLINNFIYAGMYEGFVWFANPWVYLSFALIVLIGFGLLRRVKLTTLMGASLSASVLFFLITNFGAWLTTPLYPKTVAGLASCYAMGIPFFWNTLLGDLFFTGLLFGAFEWAQFKFPALRLQSA